MAFRLQGISSYHCVEAQIYGSKNVIEFLKEGSQESFGSVMYVEPDPVKLGKKIVEDMIEKRINLGWAVPDQIHEPLINRDEKKTGNEEIKFNYI